VLIYRNTKLAVVEAKAWDEELTEGVAQAKNYAGKLAVRFTFATNGQGINAIDMETGEEGAMAGYPLPDRRRCRAGLTRQAREGNAAPSP
jgi:type I restriction enzyme R subunit